MSFYDISLDVYLEWKTIKPEVPYGPESENNSRYGCRQRQGRA